MPLVRRLIIQKSLGFLALGLGALISIVLGTIWLSSRAQTYLSEVAVFRDLRVAAVELRSSLQTAESSQRGFLITGNEIYLAPYARSKAQVRRQLDIIKGGKVGGQLDPTLLGRLDDIVTQKFGEMDQTNLFKSSQRDGEANAIMRSNRGKALMDEANVFLSSIVLSMDERLTAGIADQSANASLLRLVSIIGGLIIIGVVAASTVTIFRYANEVSQVGEEVRALNENLELRVKKRTSELAAERDRASMLLTEVNHRVANSLTLVTSLIQLQANAIKDPAARKSLADTRARINAVGMVHKRLYTSGDVRVVALDEYLSALLAELQDSFRSDGLGTSLQYTLEPIELSTDATINLGVVVVEWVTNAVKYAYPDGPGEVRIKLQRVDEGRAELLVEDDGRGLAEEKSNSGTGLGTRIVKAIATGMKADINYIAKTPGTIARLLFPIPEPKRAEVAA